MIISNPFAYLSSLNGTEDILDEYIFSNNEGLALLVLTFIAALVAVWDLYVRDLASRIIARINFPEFLIKYFPWFLRVLVLIGCITYLAIDLTDTYNLVSLSGLAAFVLIAIILSSKRSKVSWKS